MKKLFFLTALLVFALSTFAQKETVVLIETNMGNIKAKLYNETPLHRDNFIKLAKEEFYDSLLFHRVIKGFMVQCGDPSSRNAKADAFLGGGGPGYLVPAEIKDGLIHKKGALAAARTGGAGNPQKKSSGSQFYIVQGVVYGQEQLAAQEANLTNAKVQQYLPIYFSKPENAVLKAELDSLLAAKQRELVQTKFNQAVSMMIAQGDVTPFKFSKKQIEAYSTVGGTPHLDGEYTVFGEMIEGFEVLDKIAAVEVNKQSRPMADVIILKVSIVK